MEEHKEGIQDYDIVRTREGISLTGDVASHIQHFHFIEGLCAADQKNPAQPRERRWYLDHVIAPLLQQGKIDDGTTTPFDDRKFRFDGMSLNGDTLEVALGISHFYACQEDQQRSDEENMAFQQKGLQDFHDQWAYFQRNPGVAGLVLSSTGSVYMGQRTNQNQMQKLNSVAGYMDYKENLHDVDLLVNLQNELAEEMGIDGAEIVSTRFVGAYCHPIKGSLDFTWIVQTSLPDSYFSPQGAWCERRTSKEHEELLRLATSHEVRMLLEEGRVLGKNKLFEIMYSTRGALESLLSSR